MAQATQETRTNGNTSNGATAQVASAQEGAKAWFRLAGAVIDEADRQVEDSLRMFSKIHEQIAASRRNLLKLAEESVEGTLDAARSMTQSIPGFARMR